MKYLIPKPVTVIAALAVAVCFTVASAGVHAQTAASIMTVRVPFEFYVENQKFPAGAYQVSVSNALVGVSDGDGHSISALTNFIQNDIKKGTGGGDLVFKRYDEHYFLSEVRMDGYRSANGLRKSKLELEIAANAGRKEQLVAVAGIRQ